MRTRWVFGPAYSSAKATPIPELVVAVQTSVFGSGMMQCRFGLPGTVDDDASLHAILAFYIISPYPSQRLDALPNSFHGTNWEEHKN